MLSKITASLICMDLSDIKTDIDTLLDNGVNWLHADFMDNTFVPRLGISPELIQWIRKRYGKNVNIDSHLMVQNPYDCVDVIAPFSDWVFFHYEATPDPVRILQKIDKVSMANKGIAYNIGTDTNEFLINTKLVNGVMFMGISPGVLGTRSWPEILKNKIVQHRCIVGHDDIPVFLDGGIDFKSIGELTKDVNVIFGPYKGADKVVCGSSTLFRLDSETKLMTRSEMIKHNIRRIEEAMQ